MTNFQSKPVMIVGGTGMLGKALMAEAKRRGKHAVSAARRGAQVAFDLASEKSVAEIDFNEFSAIINAAAVTNLNECEANPALAHRINGVAAGELASAAKSAGIPFFQISTDHFFTGDGAKKHGEDDPVILLNAYAKSKFEGEKLSIGFDRALVIRTNLVGWRGWAGQPTFVEWVKKQLETGSEFTAFDDFYTSSLDVESFSRACFKLLDMPENHRPVGRLNLGSAQVASKLEFIQAFAERFEFKLNRMKIGSLRQLSGAPRAESLGLDVTKAELALGHSLPNLKCVVDSLWATRPL